MDGERILLFILYSSAFVLSYLSIFEQCACAIKIVVR